MCTCARLQYRNQNYVGATATLVLTKKYGAKTAYVHTEGGQDTAREQQTGHCVYTEGLSLGN